MTKPGLVQKQVLVISRDVNYCLAVAARLEQDNMRVHRAAERQDALPLMYETRPDLVLLEISSESDDGWVTLSKIRLLTDIPVILMAERPSRAERKRGAVLGANGIVAKSVSPARLAAVVKSRLARSSQPRAATKRERSDPPDASRANVSLRFLTLPQLTQIDRALADVGIGGEVWIAKKGGRLESITKVRINEPQFVAA